jgi:peptidylglycine monooxygenase
MAHERLYVTLGPRRYRVERPWGNLPEGHGHGRVSDVALDPRTGRIHVLLRIDCYEQTLHPAVIVLEPDGNRAAAYGAREVVDAHMMAVAPDGRAFVVDRDAQQIVVFDTDGMQLATIGTRHRALEPFNAPCDVAFAPDGSIYVADGYAASLVHRFSRNFEPMGRWGKLGTGPGEFSTPHSVWVLPDGRVAVADRENNRVQIFAPEGRFLSELLGPHKPMSVHGDAEGNIYVTDQVPSLWLFGADGSLRGRCRPVLNGAHGMTISPDGTIYLAEQNPNRLTRLVPVED